MYIYETSFTIANLHKKDSMKDMILKHMCCGFLIPCDTECARKNREPESKEITLGFGYDRNGS